MHRDTILTPAIGFALLALTAIGAGSTLSTAATAQATPPAQTKAPPSPGAAAPAAGDTAEFGTAAALGARRPAPGSGAQGQGSRPAGASQAVGTAGGRGAAQVGRPRRRSYAACNRISHTRGLRGGARRRFLVRCKLGYDRPRTGQPQEHPTAVRKAARRTSRDPREAHRLRRRRNPRRQPAPHRGRAGRGLRRAWPDGAEPDGIALGGRPVAAAGLPPPRRRRRPDRGPVRELQARLQHPAPRPELTRSRCFPAWTSCCPPACPRRRATRHRHRQGAARGRSPDRDPRLGGLVRHDPERRRRALQARPGHAAPGDGGDRRRARTPR